MPSHWCRNKVAAGLIAIAAGLGVGIGSSRLFPPPAGPREETVSSVLNDGWAPVSDVRPTEKAPVRSPAPLGGGKRALLVGVTKYDHLAPSTHLKGPGNDVRLLRTTLAERYGFRPENIVSLTEDEGGSHLRPTRANIAREFKRLAEAVQAGDQVVVLMAGHGAREPESDPPDPLAPEPDGLDEIFLPADARPWSGLPDRVPNAIADKELRDWLGAITAKRAYVWAIFDCCHSGSLTRGAEAVRQLPTGILVPRAELDKARSRAAQRPTHTPPDRGARGWQRTATTNDYLVATFACREFETTYERPQPDSNSPTARVHGLFTYTVVGVLQRAAASATPVTYHDLMQQVQTNYLGLPQGAPSPIAEGMGLTRVVLGTDVPVRPKISLVRVKGEHLVNVGDLHGLTPGSVLRVHSTGTGAPDVLGHVRVGQTRPLDSVVTAIAYGGMPKPVELPAAGRCEVVAVGYSTTPLGVWIDPGGGAPEALRSRVADAFRTIPKAEAGFFKRVEDAGAAQFVVRVTDRGPELMATSGNRPPVPLPALDDERFEEVLADKLRTIHRARSLTSVGTRLDADSRAGSPGSDVKIEVLLHNTPGAPGRVVDRPPNGWVFRPGDQFSVRVTNVSKNKLLEVTLLLVDLDYQIHVLHPGQFQTNKALEPGRWHETKAASISDTPPFGTESMIVIVTAPTNPPVNYGLLARAGKGDRGYTPKSPLAQLLESNLYGSGSRTALTVPDLAYQGARVLSWRTEPKGQP